MRGAIVIGNIYHVLSRGVDKREIFLDDKDRFRWIHDLFEFNDQNLLKNNVVYRFRRSQYKDSRSPYIGTARNLLVEVLAFCLMPNHYHLMIRPLVEGGLVKFMQRLNMGFAKYFNERYNRKGVLFEGRYKCVPVLEESHFIHLPYYIHCNPLDLYMPEWRERSLSDYKKAISFLDAYRWSSHLDYSGKKNFPSVTQREFLSEIFGGSEKYTRNLNQWLEAMNVTNFQDVTLE